MSEEPHVITVFGSSRPRAGDADYEAARALGRALAARGFTVCSGGYGGVMEGVSRGAREGGGRSEAVTAAFFASRANAWVDQEIRVQTWQERLFELVRRGRGYVACKGGTGTLVELAVVWEMLNKRVMAGKPCVVLGAFWRPILERVREAEVGHASAWSEASHPLIHIAPTPEDAAEYLAAQLARTKVR